MAMYPVNFNFSKPLIKTWRFVSVDSSLLRRLVVSAQQPLNNKLFVWLFKIQPCMIKNIPLLRSKINPDQLWLRMTRMTEYSLKCKVHLQTYLQSTSSPPLVHLQLILGLRSQPVPWEWESCWSAREVQLNGGRSQQYNCLGWRGQRLFNIRNLGWINKDNEGLQSLCTGLLLIC